MSCMRTYSIPAAFLFVWAVAAGAHAQQVRSLDLLWAGTYEVTATREVEDVTAPAGRRKVAGGVQPLVATDRIPAELGTRFGIGFVLRGEPAGAKPEVYAIWHFPQRGLTNPQTRTTTYVWRMDLRHCPIEREPYCLVGYPLQHAWELVPGTWRVEIWAEGRKLAEKSFELYVPDPAPSP